MLPYTDVSALPVHTSRGHEHQTIPARGSGCDCLFLLAPKGIKSCGNAYF